MSDPSVTRWRQRGRVYLWRYKENTRNYPGWHMTADHEACTSLVELIDAMQVARWPSNATVAVSPPTDDILLVPNNRGGAARWTAPTSLKLKYTRDQVDADFWSLGLQGGTLILAMGATALATLQKGILDIANGKGDYCIGADEAHGTAGSDAVLWFWWLPRGSEEQTARPEGQKRKRWKQI